MRRTVAITRWRLLLVAALVLAAPGERIRAEELSRKVVVESIEKGKAFLLKAQRNDGSWQSEINSTYSVGITSLALLALINSGMSVHDREIQQGLS